MGFEEKIAQLKQISEIAALAGLKGEISDDGFAFMLGFEMDGGRSQVVRALFREMGFRGTEHEARTRMVLTYESCEPMVYPRRSRAERERLLVERHRVLVAGSTQG